MKTDRFKLEERVMRAWATSDDIEDFVTRFYEYKKRMSEDEVFNLIWGIKELHDTRMQILMETFQQVFKLDDYASDEAKELRKQIFDTKEGECND